MEDIKITCQDHSGMCVNMENVKKAIETNTSDIRTVSEAVIKLTVIMERMEQMQQTQQAAQQTQVEVKKGFWDTPTKQLMLKLSFGVLVLLILALLGVNLAEGFDLAKAVVLTK